jgi:O-antigen ligase
MYFLIFTVCTAPFFLAPYSLEKYGFWFVVLIFLIQAKKIDRKVDGIVKAYFLFCIWLLISFTHTQSWYEGAMLLIKYLLPLLFLWLGYSSIKDEYTLYYFLKYTNKIAIIYAFLIGGFSAVFMPWLYYSAFGGMFLKYAGLADYFTSIFVIPLILYWITKRKVYLLGALWLALSALLESVRTGIGGIFLVVLFYSFFRYKLKSIPLIGLAVVVFIGVILFVPDVNEKMFGENAGSVTAKEIVQEDALSLDNIQTSGRNELWEITLDRYYKPHPWVGSGLGTAMHFIKSRGQVENTIMLLHSDYVQLLSETGIIGILLLSFFYLTLIYKVFHYIWVVKCNVWIKVSGIMAISSMAGIAFAMAFDNVVSHSMTSLINPFIFIGFFLKFIDLSKKKA